MTKIQVQATIQIGVLFVAPILLLLAGIFPIQYRFYVLLSVTIFVVVVIIAEKRSLNYLGIRFDNVRQGVPQYIMFTVFVTVGIIVLAWLLKHNSQSIVGNVHFQYGFIILSFLQEFLFRSFLIPKLKAITASPVLIIAVNGLLFGFLHLIFPNPFSLFVFSSLLGFGFAAVYFFRPNLLLATVAHAVINFVAVFYCFASFAASCN